MKKINTIRISILPIELNKLLKLENLVTSGGEAKILISEGSVEVNGEIEYQIRKKIFDGDSIKINNKIYVVKQD